MSQLLLRSDDTYRWGQGFGKRGDGILTQAATATESVVNTTLSGTEGDLTGTVGSGTGLLGKCVYIQQAQGVNATKHQVNFVINVVGTTVTFLYPLVATFSSAQLQVFKEYSVATISSTFILTANAFATNKGGVVAWIIDGPLTINGTLNLAGNNAAAHIPGTGVGFGGAALAGAPPGLTGVGTGGASVQSTSANGNGGAGQNNDTSSGGGGGNATVGETGGGSAPGVGGNAVGNAELTLASLGGGASGGFGSSATGAGGAGAGLAIIICRSLIINPSTGRIILDGGAGGPASGGGTPGSGGAGGSLLIKCQNASLGTNRITALAGAAGTGSPAYGAAGSVGRIHIDYSNSITGSSNPTLSSRKDKTLANAFFGGMI